MSETKSNEQLLDEQISLAAKQQEASLVIDFDAALAERVKRETPLRITFRGREFTVPRTLPAAFQLFFFRHCTYRDTKTGKVYTNVPEDRAYEFMRLMFGAEFVEFVQEHPDVPFDLIFDTLSTRVLEEWGLSVQPQGGDGKQ